MKVKRQFCSARSHAELLCCTAPQSVRSSHSLKMQEQLPWLSLSQWTLPCRATTSTCTSSLPLPPIPFHCCYISNLSNLYVNRHAKGRAADAADTQSFGYTKATKALLFTPPLPSLSFTSILHCQLALVSWLGSSSALFGYLPLNLRPKQILSSVYAPICRSH